MVITLQCYTCTGCLEKLLIDKTLYFQELKYQASQLKDQRSPMCSKQSRCFCGLTTHRSLCDLVTTNHLPCQHLGSNPGRSDNRLERLIFEPEGPLTLDIRDDSLIIQ